MWAMSAGVALAAAANPRRSRPAAQTELPAKPAAPRNGADKRRLSGRSEPETFQASGADGAAGQAGSSSERRRQAAPQRPQRTRDVPGKRRRPSCRPSRQLLGTAPTSGASAAAANQRRSRQAAQTELPAKPASPRNGADKRRLSGRSEPETFQASGADRAAGQASIPSERRRQAAPQRPQRTRDVPGKRRRPSCRPSQHPLGTAPTSGASAAAANQRRSRQAAQTELPAKPASPRNGADKRRLSGRSEPETFQAGGAD